MYYIVHVNILMSRYIHVVVSTMPCKQRNKNDKKTATQIDDVQDVPVMTRICLANVWVKTAELPPSIKSESQ